MILMFDAYFEFAKLDRCWTMFEFSFIQNGLFRITVIMTNAWQKSSRSYTTKLSKITTESHRAINIEST
jgi:hypothetical protein